jgi:hypothetical protein
MSAMDTGIKHRNAGKNAASSTVKRRLQTLGSVVGAIIFLLALLAFVQWIGWYVFIDILVAISTSAIIYAGWRGDRDAGKKHEWSKDIKAVVIVAACLGAGELIVWLS